RDDEGRADDRAPGTQAAGDEAGPDHARIRYRERDRDGGRDSSRDAERSHRPAPRPPQRSNDPFFDRPYEPTAADQKPAWETEAPAKPTSGVSRNIKPRRKVATLLGGVVTPAD
ncbi:MAG: hypothetical protein ACKOE3_05530, partial [Betaproteobacteria bacterium]